MRVSKDDPNKADLSSASASSCRSTGRSSTTTVIWIGFGPDGMLYVSTGDGGYANDWGIGHNVTLGNGQDTASLNGKILRIDPTTAIRYTVPKDNPFVGNSNYAPEIWAIGFRNPWRCSFDQGGTQELFCADVGQNSYEEVDIVVKGAQLRLARAWKARTASTTSTRTPIRRPATRPG